MKNFRTAILSLSLSLLLAAPAAAQWQVQENAVPIGRGGGAQGFKFAAPSTAGSVLTSTGTGSAPAFLPMPPPAVPFPGPSTLGGVFSSPAEANKYVTGLGSDGILIKASQCSNVTVAGLTGDGATDNYAALVAVLNSLPASGGCLYFPKGKYLLSARVVKTLGSVPATITIKGDGSQLTELYWPNSNGGMQFNAGVGFDNVAHVDGVTFITGQVGGGTGLEFNGNVSIPRLQYSSINDVAFRGNDTANTQYWSLAMNFKVWSKWNISKFHVLGSHVAGGRGAGMQIAGDPATTTYGIVYNVSQCDLQSLATAFIYGDYIQGATIDQCNFQGGVNGGAGILAGAGYVGTQSQLYISNSQFDVLDPISLNSNIYTVGLSNVTLSPNRLNGVGLFGVNLTYLNIVNSFFYPYDAATNTQTAIKLTGTGTTGTIVGNTFAQAAVGVDMAAGINNVIVYGNTYNAVTVKTLNAGTNSVITSDPADAPVNMEKSTGAYTAAIKLPNNKWVWWLEAATSAHFGISGDAGNNIVYQSGASGGHAFKDSLGGLIATFTLASGMASNKAALLGSTSGQINLLPQAVSGTYNFNFPTTAGTANQVLRSQGGGATPMDWVSLATVATSGSASDLSTGTVPVARGGVDQTAWTSYTPTYSCFSGAITTATATGAQKTVGKTVFFTAKLVITAFGTCATAVILTLPSVSQRDFSFAGKEVAVVGKGLTANVTAASNSVTVTFADGTNPGAANYTLVISGQYEGP